MNYNYDNRPTPSRPKHRRRYQRKGNTSKTIEKTRKRIHKGYKNLKQPDSSIISTLNPFIRPKYIELLTYYNTLKSKSEEEHLTKNEKNIISSIPSKLEFLNGLNEYSTQRSDGVRDPIFLNAMEKINTIGLSEDLEPWMRNLNRKMSLNQILSTVFRDKGIEKKPIRYRAIKLRKLEEEIRREHGEYYLCMMSINARKGVEVDRDSFREIMRRIQSKKRRNREAIENIIKVVSIIEKGTHTVYEERWNTRETKWHMHLCFFIKPLKEIKETWSEIEKLDYLYSVAVVPLVKWLDRAINHVKHLKESGRVIGEERDRECDLYQIAVNSPSGTTVLVGGRWLYHHTGYGIVHVREGVILSINSALNKLAYMIKTDLNMQEYRGVTGDRLFQIFTL